MSRIVVGRYLSGIELAPNSVNTALRVLVCGVATNADKFRLERFLHIVGANFQGTPLASRDLHRRHANLLVNLSNAIAVSATRASVLGCRKLTYFDPRQVTVQ